MNRPILIHGPARDIPPDACGGTRVHERRETRRPRRQILGGPARICGHARQRDDVPPVLTTGERVAEVVRRAARGHGMSQRGQATRQLTGGRVATGVLNAVLAGGGGGGGISRYGAAAEGEPPRAALCAPRLRRHPFLAATPVE